MLGKKECFRVLLAYLIYLMGVFNASVVNLLIPNSLLAHTLLIGIGLVVVMLISNKKQEVEE